MPGKGWLLTTLPLCQAGPVVAGNWLGTLAFVFVMKGSVGVGQLPGCQGVWENCRLGWKRKEKHLEPWPLGLPPPEEEILVVGHWDQPHTWPLTTFPRETQ